ncbi:malate dehydrogenase, NAD-dependent [Basidiobolus meristosporus CBS 931.73]|uniref:malate dehydrogenase n=1 Tax=Basidiobolus meristosporus CBS 931.73 TaxID=1314790 RepID=A0A1Y1Y8L9_9FUNG|nr:malate dehydrogenase, NAD-dependent [Basidiobolus meristosporus CBS 931.73]|eukprot:ORX94370.1 malate dehydrogenase, NAD-dependent [Basidiobolus meristosporus CBS 931.73]
MVKVAVLGAAGGIGQPLSLLLKQNTLISHLALYDLVNVPGVAADLSHINTPSKVTAHLGADNLQEALADAHVVVIPAGVPRKPGMTRDDLFKINAGIVRDLATAASKYCPKAFMLIISNPVNSTVPIVAEVFKKAGVYDPKRLFGVSTLDVVRASRFVSEVNPELNPVDTRVTVIGGHSGTTIIPLLSQLNPTQKFTQEQIEALTHRIQFGGDEVVKAKDGAGSATLSMAFAGARFAINILEASVGGKTGIIEPSYVDLSAYVEGGNTVKAETQDCAYFATNVELGKDGVEKIFSIGKLSEFEQKLLAEAIPQLKANVESGVNFINA